MKRGFLLTALCLVSMACAAQAEAQDGELGVTLDLEYRSKWLSKGVEAYGQQGAFFKTLDVDWYGTGYGVKVTHREATSSGYVDSERIDYRPYYKSVLFEDQSYLTNFNISAGYEHYPGLARHRSYTTWEWILALSWPELAPEGIVPAYIAHYEYAAGENYTKQNGADIPSGWVHRFILGYDLETPQTPAPLHLSSEVAYTDGLGGAEHDWGYAVFGVSTKVKIAENLAFLPGVYQQVSMEDSVSRRKDITYCILTMRYKF